MWYKDCNHISSDHFNQDYGPDLMLTLMLMAFVLKPNQTSTTVLSHHKPFIFTLEGILIVLFCMLPCLTYTVCVTYP